LIKQSNKTSKNKKASDPDGNLRLSFEALFIYIYKLLTNFVNFDLLLEALFLWITFFLANLSSMEVTCFSSAFASSLSEVFLSFLIKVLVVFAWYRFLNLLASFDRILLSADL